MRFLLSPRCLSKGLRKAHPFFLLWQAGVATYCGQCCPRNYTEAQHEQRLGAAMRATCQPWPDAPPVSLLRRTTLKTRTSIASIRRCFSRRRGWHDVCPRNQLPAHAPAILLFAPASIPAKAGCCETRVSTWSPTSLLDPGPPQTSETDNHADLCACRNYHETLLAHGVKCAAAHMSPRLGGKRLTLLRFLWSLRSAGRRASRTCVQILPRLLHAACTCTRGVGRCNRVSH